MRYSVRPRAVCSLLLPFALACSGDRAPEASRETTAAGGSAVTDSATFGDTALAPAAGTVPTGRPVPGVTTGAGTATASPGATATTTDAVPGAPAATATAPVASTAVAPDAAGGAAVGGSSALTPGATGATPGASQPASTVASAVAPTPSPNAATPASNRRAEVPFAINERVEYDVRFGSLDVGDAAMQVNGVETLRGREAYHTVFRVSGGTLFFKVNDRYESWIDTRSLVSLRHVQQIDEGNYERERTFEIYPDRGVYRENDKPEQKTVAEPLDDGSFFYFVRTIPLEVGKTYEFNRYFKPDRNPVTIKVVRRERVKVPAGTYNAVVIQPIIKTKGIFGEGGRAEIWLADDSTRAMLQMKSDLKFGSLNLYLKRLEMGRRPGG